MTSSGKLFFKQFKQVRWKISWKVKQKPGRDIMMYRSKKLSGQHTNSKLTNKYQYRVNSVFLNRHKPLSDDARVIHNLLRIKKIFTSVSVRSFPSGEEISRWGRIPLTMVQGVFISPVQQWPRLRLQAMLSTVIRWTILITTVSIQSLPNVWD